MRKKSTSPRNVTALKINETKDDRLSIVTAFVKKYLSWIVVGGICSIIGVYFTIRSNMRESEKASAQVDIKIGGLEFDDYSTVLVYYICPIDDIGTNYINGILPLTISNNTNFDVDNIHVRLWTSLETGRSAKMPLSSNPVGLPIQLPKTYKYRRFFNPKHLDKIEISEQAYCTYTYSPEEGIEYTDYKVRFLPPGMKLDIRQDFMIDTLKPYYSARPELGRPTFADYFMSYLECIQSNQQPYTIRLGMVVINGETIDDFFNIITSLKILPVTAENIKNERRHFLVICPTYYLDHTGKATVDINHIKIIKGEYIPKKWFRKRKVKFYNIENDELLKTILLEESPLTEIGRKWNTYVN